MDINSQKIKFIQEFLRINSEELINKLDKFLRDEKVKMYEQELKPLTLEEFNAMIDEAEEDIKNGRFTDAETLLEDIKKWK